GGCFGDGAGPRCFGHLRLGMLLSRLRGGRLLRAGTPQPSCWCDPPPECRRSAGSRCFVADGMAASRGDPAGRGSLELNLWAAPPLPQAHSPPPDSSAHAFAYPSAAPAYASPPDAPPNPLTPSDAPPNSPPDPLAQADTPPNSPSDALAQADTPSDPFAQADA